MTKTQKTIAWTGGALLVALCLFALRVTPEDIAACRKATGWSADHCQNELSR